MRKRQFTGISIIATAALSVLITLGAVALAAWFTLGSSGMAVVTGTAVINSKFVGEYDREAAADDTLDAMVASLGDRWSYYLNSQQNQAQTLRRDNAYVGIGITSGVTPDGVYIVQVMPGGPAEQAGLNVGEIILAVDGVEITEENVSRLSELIQGEEGTQTVLTVLDQAGETRQVTVIRARLQLNPVYYELLEGNVGYVALANFYKGSADQAVIGIEQLLDQGAQSLVIDVRGNPGGFMDQMTQLLDYLLPKGAIFQSGTRRGPDKVVYSDAACVDVPVAVLIDQDSYSAAELFAAQMRESAGSCLVGQPTCGKGYSQQTFQLPGGRALNISTKTYYTGAGVSLIGTGVSPDIRVEQTAGEDAQLAAALSQLRQ